MAERSLLMFVRGALRLLQRRRRRLAQPPAGLGELVRLFLPLLPRPCAAASEAATASSSIAVLLLSAGIRRLPRELLLAVDGVEGRGPYLFPDLDDEAARQLVLGVVLARLGAGRARIYADAAAGEAAPAPPDNAIDDIYHDAGAGAMARRLLVFVHALLRLAPPPAGPAQQVASEAATATCSIIALLLAVDGVLDLDDPRAGRLLIRVFLAWVRAAAVPAEAALAPDDALQNAHEDPIAADKPHEEEKTAIVVVSTIREALEVVRLWDEGVSMMVDVPAHLECQDAVDIDEYLTSRGATPAALRRGPVLTLILTGAGGQ